MAGGLRHGEQLGSVVLLAVAVLLILRPWEGHGGRDEGPSAARAFVVRVVDGDTIEARIGDRVEDVRYIGMLSRVSSPALRLPPAVTG
jgi:hypothetical protein